MSAPMVEVPVAELEGPALRYAVAKVVDWRCGGNEIDLHGKTLSIDDARGGVFEPDRDWRQGGPLLDAYRVGFALYPDSYFACTGLNDVYGSAYGATHLIAACRAIVAANLGDRLQVPAELAGGTPC